MIVDIGEVKRHIKPKADSTLHNMRKDDLVRYIRCLEHNYNVAVSFNENQAKYIESLKIAEVYCKDCKFYTESKNRCDHPCMDYDVECYDQWLEVNPDDFCSYGERRSDHETDKSG